MKTLFCTVGGSPAPILRTIEQHQPDRIVFVCSADDPSSHRKGSYVQIEGKNLVCKSHPGLDTPDLPNLPSQASLAKDGFSVLQVPADDPATIIEQLEQVIARELGSDNEIVADYTGGTKSMSAALFYVATMHPDVRLSLVTGPRVDLIRIQSTAGSAVRVDDRPIRVRWGLRQAAGAWARHAYGEAVHLLEDLQSADSRVQRALGLSQGYAAWDALEYQRAYDVLQTFGRWVGRAMPIINRLANAQRHLGDPVGVHEDDEALLIWDVFRKCEREVGNHRFDTAMLLLYRVVEWVAQWSLRVHHQVDCSDVRPEVVGEHHDLVSTSPGGKATISSRSAWTLLGRLAGPLAEVAQQVEGSLLTFNERRNFSVFAHGKRPVTRAAFEDARTWFETHIKAAFLKTASKGKEPFEQLPVGFPKGLLAEV